MNPSANAASTTGGSINPIPMIRGVEYRCGDCGAKNVIKGGGTFIYKIY